MAKVAVAVRLDPEVVEWADAYAKGRGVSRQVVLEGAVLDFREGAERGVPDLADGRVPRPESKAKPVPPASVVPPVRRLSRSKQSELAMARMRRMDPRRYG